MFSLFYNIKHYSYIHQKLHIWLHLVSSNKSEKWLMFKLNTILQNLHSADPWNKQVRSKPSSNVKTIKWCQNQMIHHNQQLYYTVQRWYLTKKWQVTNSFFPCVWTCSLQSCFQVAHICLCGMTIKTYLLFKDRSHLMSAYLNLTRGHLLPGMTWESMISGRCSIRIRLISLHWSCSPIRLMSAGIRGPHSFSFRNLKSRTNGNFTGCQGNKKPS